MASADEITIGDYCAAGLDDGIFLAAAEQRLTRERPPAVSIVPGLTLSVLLHLALASSVLYLLARDAGVERLPEVSTLRVEFVSRSSLVPATEEPEFDPPLERPSPSPTTDDASASPLDGPAATGLPEFEGVVDVASPADNALEFESEQSSATDRADQQRRLISVPNVDSVRSAIVATRREAESSMRVRDCNLLERERPFNDCRPEEAGDYSAGTRNRVYEYFNPAIEDGRSGRAVTEIARHSDSVSRSLSLSNLPAGLSAYVMQEVEQGIETYSNPSVRALDHMNTMVDKSAAGVMSRRLFDPWVLQQSSRLDARRAKQR